MMQTSKARSDLVHSTNFAHPAHHRTSAELTIHPLCPMGDFSRRDDDRNDPANALGGERIVSRTTSRGTTATPGQIEDKH